LVRYYLANPMEREAISRRGWQKATEIYNARNMWGYIFERLGFRGWLTRDSDYLKHKGKMEKL